MKTLHEKSSCCRARVCRFGGRRRQCALCLRTWSAWKRKRGRKHKRSNVELVKKYLDHAVPSMHAKARHRKVISRTLERQLERSRDLFLRVTSWPILPKREPLILIADADVKYIKRKWYTAYCMLVRTIESNEAVIAPPVVLDGTETAKGWGEALDTLPYATRSSITAIVCDGHSGLVNYARWSNWLIQRCHFHLIARIQSRRSRWKQSRHKEEGEKIYKLVNRILTNRSEKTFTSTISEIEEIGWLTKSPDLSRALLGFVNNYRDFRTYIYHPELNLPTTSNTAESFISCIEGLCHRARGFSSKNSFEKWIFALVKHKKKIKCNGNYQQN